MSRKVDFSLRVVFLESTRFLASIIIIGINANEFW